MLFVRIGHSDRHQNYNMYYQDYCPSGHEVALPDVGDGNGADGELLGLVLDPSQLVV